MIWFVLAVIVAVTAHHVILRRYEAWKARRAVCEAEGHTFTEVFDALDVKHWPTRRCTHCGHQEDLSRCPCGKLVHRVPPYEVFDEARD